jgi:hypothetical protein
MSYIYMVYTWYIHGYTMYIHQTGYTWYIHGYPMYIHKLYTWYIHGYTWYIIWCIYVVYTWYIVEYPWTFRAFWNQISRQASTAGLIQCAHACGWSRVLDSKRHHGNCARGKGCPQKAQPDCRQCSPPVAQLLVAAVTAAAAAVSRAAFHFPSLLAGNNLNLGEGWGRGCLQDRWPGRDHCVKELWLLSALKIEKKN